MSNIIIPREHQSVPKLNDVDLDIKKSAEEIRDGKFTPKRERDEFFDVKADTAPRTKEDVEEGRVFNQKGMIDNADLEMHPRVQEALARLSTRIKETKSAEYLEAAEQSFELNKAIAAKHKWEGQERWMGKEAIKARLVNPMSPFLFIEKLQAAGIDATFDVEEVVEEVPNPKWNPQRPVFLGGEPPTIRMPIVRSNKKIYIGKRVVEDCVALFAKVPDIATGKVIDKRVSKLMAYGGPEWSVVRFDEYDIPCGQSYHGWRTALLALITFNVITEADAIRAFGVAQGEPSEFYNQQLHEWRNVIR